MDGWWGVAAWLPGHAQLRRVGTSAQALALDQTDEAHMSRSAGHLVVKHGARAAMRRDGRAGSGEGAMIRLPRPGPGDVSARAADDGRRRQVEEIAVPRTQNNEGTGLKIMTRVNQGCAPTASSSVFALLSADMSARIVGLSGTTTLTHVYCNTASEAIDAAYSLPLPDRAAVARFSASVGGRTVDLRLAERVQAQDSGDDVGSSTMGGGLLRVRLGVVGPGERVEIVLGLVGPLALDGDVVSFRFPTSALKHCLTGIRSDGSDDADGSVCPPTQRLPGSMSARVEIDSVGLARQELACSLPAAVSPLGDGRTQLRVNPGLSLDRDLVLQWRVGAADLQTAIVLQPDGGGGEATVSITVVPPQPDPRSGMRPRDIVVLLDRSGSMEGWQMVAARRAAARIVDSLTPADRVAVLAFDHEVALGEPAARLAPATDHHRFVATRYLADLQARGGTDLLAALHAAAAALGAEDSTRRRILVLVTDGQIDSEARLSKVIQNDLADATIHVVGIDRAVPAGLLRRLAGLGAGGGHAEQVESQECLDAALARIRDDICSAVLTDVEFDVEGAGQLAGTGAQPGMTSCPAGVPVVIRSRVHLHSDGPVRVRLRGRDSAGEPWTASAVAAVRPGAAETAMWARDHLAGLEDQWLTSRGERNALRAVMVAASVRFQSLCRFTGFARIRRTESQIGVAREQQPPAVDDPLIVLPQLPDEPWADATLMDFLDWIDRILDVLSDAMSTADRILLRHAGEDLAQLLDEFDAWRGESEERLSRLLHETGVLCSREEVDAAAMRNKVMVARRLLGDVRQRLRVGL